MTITQGKVHKYLRITVDYSSPGKVIFSMIDYIVKMLDDITEYIKGKSATPAAHHLFAISEDATKLSQSDADFFHHFVAQLIYLSKWAHPEIHLVHRKDTTSWISGCALFERYISCATK